MIRPSSKTLVIDDLKKSFGKLRALCGVSFTLGSAERLAFLGPNGAGKTTLIRCLAGRTRPDAGQVHLLGQPITATDARLSLGLVPQEIAFYADLTTRENLQAFGRFYGLRRRELRDRVDWALVWTGLVDRADELVGGFSGGMKRRVNLACGVLHSPTILLLDEPTVGVDPQSRQRIFSMLDELHGQGTSILLTTHHLEEAQQTCDRIVILDQGRVIADGTIDELVQQTVGASRLVRLTIDQPLREPFRFPTADDDPVADRGETCVSMRIDDVSIRLPELLQSIRHAGYVVSDVEVNAPSLHHVFLHLTGHELRDSVA